MVRFVSKLWTDEKGEDVAEYAMTLGLVAIVAIAIIATVGTNIQTWWNNISTEITNHPVPNS